MTNEIAAVNALAGMQSVSSPSPPPTSVQVIHASQSTDWKTRLAEQAIKQGPTFVILLLILAMLAWTGHYIATVGLPGAMATIQDGYQKQQSGYERSLSTIEQTHLEKVKLLSESHSRDMDRVSASILDLSRAVESAVQKLGDAERSSRPKS